MTGGSLEMLASNSSRLFAFVFRALYGVVQIGDVGSVVFFAVDMHGLRVHMWLERPIGGVRGFGKCKCHTGYVFSNGGLEPPISERIGGLGRRSNPNTPVDKMFGKRPQSGKFKKPR